MLQLVCLNKSFYCSVNFAHLLKFFGGTFYDFAKKYSNSLELLPVEKAHFLFHLANNSIDNVSSSKVVVIFEK